MALLDFQNLILRLYTDKKLLTEFCADREVVVGKYNLSDKEKKALFGISRVDIKHFQRSLYGKRKKLISGLLKKNLGVVLSTEPFVTHPVLVFKNKAKETTRGVTEGELAMLKKIGGEISVNKLCTAYFLSRESTIADFWHLIVFFTMHGLYGRGLIIL